MRIALQNSIPMISSIESRSGGDHMESNFTARGIVLCDFGDTVIDENS